MREEMRGPGFKRCSKCSTIKPIGEFHGAVANRDGLQGYCKLCANVSQRASYNGAARTEQRRSPKREHGEDCRCKACAARENKANAAMGLKRCAKCRVTKPFGEFHPKGTARQGFHSYCKPCGNARVAIAQRKHRHSMTAEEFDALLEQQDGRCACCGDKFGDSRPMIDHDHKCCSGRRACGKCVRALLCRYCNTALGMIKDDPNKALALAAYLMRFEDVLAQGVSQWA